MKIKKLRQFGLVLCCLVSLFITSAQAAAIVCLDRETTQTAEESDKYDQSDRAVLSEFHFAELTEGECCCVQSAPKVFAKPETIKLEKQAALVSRISPPELLSSVEEYFSPETVFLKPFYLSNSFYKLTPGRAPPRL